MGNHRIGGANLCSICLFYIGTHDIKSCILQRGVQEVEPEIELMISQRHSIICKCLHGGCHRMPLGGALACGHEIGKRVAL